MQSRRAFMAAMLAGRNAGFQRGVNFTAERPDIYDSPKAVALLQSLPSYGVNAVALVPYGFSPLGRGEVRFGGERMWERDDAIERMAGTAHEAGMKVLLKPQVWVGGGYPAAVDFESAEERGRWFGDYGRFVDHYSGLAAKIRAEIFCVGVEFAKLSKREKEWRSLVARARQAYSGAVTYGAAQGEDFEQLPFGDALDYLGLNCYYALPDSLNTRELESRVEKVQRRWNRPVIFPEAGYSSVVNCHRQPWAERQGEVSMEAQARCYEALLKAFYAKPWFAGVYWWKVGSNGFGGTADRTHTPWGKPAMDVIKRHYLNGRR
ncbi:MAG: hypothetical protein HZB13_16525 [Acidobacteria bacterium]|nr:hypothetical protein [Acidobacteriota bacterium]